MMRNSLVKKTRGRTESSCGTAYDLHRMINFILDDGVARARIDLLGDGRAEVGEHFGRLRDPFNWYVGIDIAAANEDWRPVQRSLIVAWRSWRPNQASTKDQESAIPLGMTSHKLARQAGPLRKATQ